MMSSDQVAANASFGPEVLDEIRHVTLALDTDELPEGHQPWPVRTVRVRDLQGDESHVYVAGRATSVAKLFADGPLKAWSCLGTFVEEEAPLVPLRPRVGEVEVLPSLKAGFTSESWEAVVAATCSRHVATIQHMILHHARETPDKVGLVYKENEWTYQGMCSAAFSFIASLKKIGVEPDLGPVAVLLAASDLSTIAYLALYAGGYTTQILESSAAGRAFRLEACPSQVMLCHQGTEPDKNTRTVFVEDIPLDSSIPAKDIHFGGGLEDVAFIEYTSGSTGRPKSVASKMYKMAHWTRWRQYVFPLTEGDDRVAYNLFFIWYWHITLAQGGVSVVYPTELNHDISALMKYLDAKSVNRCDCLTPGLIGTLLEVESELPKSLKMMISGGEALPTATCRAWLSRWRHCELINNYALTEAAADMCFCKIDDHVANMDFLYVPISDGIVAWNNVCEIVDEELVLVGWNVADGYLPPTVSKAFEVSPCGRKNRYRTGDRAKWVEGKLAIFGRVDSVVKIRGHRVDLAGLEAMVVACDKVKDVAMVAWRDAVWCTVVTKDLDGVKGFSKKEIPQSDLIVWRDWDELPYTKSGKRDRKRILQMLEQSRENELQVDDLPGGPALTPHEARVADVWKAVLGRPVGRLEPFQQAGGHSLAAMRIAKQLSMTPAEVFAYPTVAALGKHLEEEEEANANVSVDKSPVQTLQPKRIENDDRDVAVVGMAARFPGAASVAEFWQALQEGQDLLTTLPCSSEFVPRKGVVPDLGFDCQFWGLPKEAATQLDTAQRTLLELAHDALQDAGLDPFNIDGRVGVVVCGGSLPHYVTEQLGIDLDECRRERPDEYFALEIGNDKDYLATMISFRLNLQGPSETVQAACSSGLVAIVRAVQMLRLGLCDYVLCGGASFSPNEAMRKVDGMIWSEDGTCRPFAEGSNGTVHSDGAGLVLLSTKKEAEAKQHRVYSVVRGACTNNDGARKAGYSAPSMEGQVEVIQAALSDAGLEGHEVDYIEAHGTGTKLGDPLELQALNKALGARRGAGCRREKEVGLGSVKGNIGHTNTVAGVPSFIKASLMLYFQQKVPSLHSSRPSPFIDWEKTKLALVDKAGPWDGRVAGVTSLGIGGTNAHVLLGVAPSSQEARGDGQRLGFRPTRTWQREPLLWVSNSKKSAVGGKKKSLKDSTKTEVAQRAIDDVSGMFYRTRLSKIEVSCVNIVEAAVILDQEAAPADLPAGWVVASIEKAVQTANACGKNLVYYGASKLEATTDDCTQEDLLQSVAALLLNLTKASRENLQIFFVLEAGPRYAGLVGLLRVAAKEHPELKLRIMIREPEAPLLFPALPVELVLRKDGSYISQLVTTSPPPAVATSTLYKKALVTGGLRGLGVKVAEWLIASKRAASLVLIGRSQAVGEAAKAIEELKKVADVEVVLGDVTRWEEVERLPDCDLVVHCAGAVKDGLLMNLTKEDAQKVYRPKIRGAVHLKKRFEAPNSRIVTFSSSSGLFGVAGQSTYAAANTYMDSILPGVQWGGWGETGMVTDLGVEPLPGERFMPVAQGLECLGRFIDSDLQSQLCVVDVDWDVFRKNPTVFYPDDTFLASIGLDNCDLTSSSLIGEALDCKDQSYVRSWDLVLGASGCRWRGSASAWEVCQQHVAGGVPLFPATAFVALAVEVVRRNFGNEANIVLSDVSFLRPLELSSTRSLATTMTLKGNSAGSLRFCSRPVDDQGNAAATLHCTCNFASTSSSSSPPPLVPAEEAEHWPSLPDGDDGFYRRFTTAGFAYGPSFRASDFRATAGAGSCHVQQHRGAPFALHPAMLDSALHLASLLHPLGCRGVPHSMKRVTFRGAHPPAQAISKLTADGEVNVQVVDESGEIRCTIDGLMLSALDAPATLQARRRKLIEYPENPRTHPWLALNAAALDMKLPGTVSRPEEPHEGVVLVVSADSLDEIPRIREQARRAAALDECWTIVLRSKYEEAAAAAAMEVGARAVVGEADDIRTFSEYLGGDARYIRVEEDGLISHEFESAEVPDKEIAAAYEPYVVNMDASKAAAGVHCRRSSRRAPEAHEVELRTNLWALNFRDVLIAVGAISTEVAGQSLGLGGECYGEVVRVGADVKGLAVGDKVIAVPPEGMGSYLTVDARWVGPSPAQMTPEEAVAGTCVYATAWLGLHWMARIQDGDRVLIHSAAGGVGLAAVHLCLRRGCTVYATASTPEKKQLLLSLGVSAVFNSRSPKEFEEGIKKVTNDEGVDVVLNSLSGEAIPTSLRLLRPFGRFIEFGKRDQYEDTPMGLNPFLSGLTYAAAHFDVLMLRQPDRCRKLLEEVWRDLEELPRLPTKTFLASDVSSALQYFSKGVHVGKILVEIDDVPVLPMRPKGLLETDATKQDLVSQYLKMHLGGEAVEAPEVLTLPAFDTLLSTSDAALKDAKVVISASAPAIAAAAKLCPQATRIQLPFWEPFAVNASGGLDDWLMLQGEVVAGEEDIAEGGDLRGWLLEVIEEMAGPIEMDMAFEDAGLDSLSLISLARRLSAKVGKSVSVADLYDNPSPQKLLDSFSGGPQRALARPKVLCIHGFRSNADAMAFQMAHITSALGGFEWVFITSPRPASGPPAPKVLPEEAREWWGQPGGAYETGWLASTSQYEGLDTTLKSIDASGFLGVVGFSQGGGVAALLKSKWTVFFSAVLPPNLKKASNETPSFHSWDPNEDYVEQMIEVSEHFTNKQVVLHNEGHVVPRDSEVVRKVIDFINAQQSL